MISLRGLCRLCTLKSKKLISLDVRYPDVYFLPSSQVIVPACHAHYYKQRSLPSHNEGSVGSRYVVPSVIERSEERIKETLTTKSFKSTQDWADFKSEMMLEFVVLTEFNFSSIIMNCLLSLNKFEEAQTFLRFLSEFHIECNFLTHLKYMALCARNIDHCGQDIILQTYNKVKAYIDAAPVLDLKSADHIIEGLCATNHWQKSFLYLKKIQIRPVLNIRNSLAAAAIRNGDESLAWEILTKWFNAEEIPNLRVLKEFMLYAQRTMLDDYKKSDHFVYNMFAYMSQRAIIADEDVVKHIAHYFRCHPKKWKVSYSKMSRPGECNACRGKLDVTDMSDIDFMHLRNRFLEKSVKKGDLFINTTEREFERYIRFIDSRKPFDIVLDGLNVAHTLPIAKTNRILASHLLKVISNFPSKKMLILARNHIRRWPQPILDQICRRADLFLTNNISQDDPFVIYAALSSGPESCVLSADLMRDHYARLDEPKLIRLFKRWQQTHQIYLSSDADGNLNFIEPLQYSINIQGNMQDGWHIPYDDKFILEPYEDINNWLCIKRME